MEFISSFDRRDRGVLADDAEKRICRVMKLCVTGGSRVVSEMPKGAPFHGRCAPQMSRSLRVRDTRFELRRVSSKCTQTQVTCQRALCCIKIFVQTSNETGRRRSR
jgi:hypothetical protein